MSKRNEPAFPIVASGYDDDAVDVGLTKFEYTAIQFAAGILAHNDCADPACAISCAERLWDELERQSCGN